MLGRRRLLLGSATALASGSVQAQQTCFERFDACFGKVLSGGYSGAGDLVSGATAWYGLRAYSAAVAATGTQKAINIRRASDNATTDILILKTGGLDIATATTFLAATTGFIATWYDQSGNGRDATQATPGAQPQLVLNAIGALPAVSFAAASSQVLTATITSVAQPTTMAAVSQRTAVAQVGILSTTSNGQFLYYTASADQAGSGSAGAGAIAATATDSAVHALLAVFNGASPNSLVRVDATETTGTTAVAATGAGLFVGSLNGSAFLTGIIGEVGLWPLGMSAGQRTAMQANQAAYYYVGPGDVVSGATAWYGLRAYSAAVAATGTQKAINIRRASDNATKDILILKTGALDIATATTFLTATTGFVVTWYDQSGNGRDATQATPANQPSFALTGGPTGSASCVVYSGASLTLTATMPVLPSGISGSFIYTRTNPAATSRSVVGDQNAYLFMGASANQVQAAEASSFVSATASDNAWHAVQTIMNGASSGINVDGSFTAGATTARASNTTTLTIGGTGVSAPVGALTEVGLWQATFTAPQYGALQVNQKAYWGTP